MKPPIGPNQQRRHYIGTLHVEQPHLWETRDAIIEFFMTDPMFSAFQGQFERAPSTESKHLQFSFDILKNTRRKTVENKILKGTGARPYLDERHYNTDYAIKEDTRIEGPFLRGRLHTIKKADESSSMTDVVNRMLNGASEAQMFNRDPIAYFKWGPKIRDFIKARNRLMDASALAVATKGIEEEE
ncbi:MAG: replication-associated protein [Cressdnaviricota sp.]|nr:MAG: replication-associated protein [Cressdnaviricota sp.]